MLAGRIHGHKTSLSSMFEAVGAYAAGNISEDELTEYETKPALLADPVPVCILQTP